MIVFFSLLLYICLFYFIIILLLLSGINVCIIHFIRHGYIEIKNIEKKNNKNSLNNYICNNNDDRKPWKWNRKKNNKNKNNEFYFIYIINIYLYLYIYIIYTLFAHSSCSEQKQFFFLHHLLLLLYIMWDDCIIYKTKYTAKQKSLSLSFSSASI
jgi:hypothetical protein